MVHEYILHYERNMSPGKSKLWNFYLKLWAQKFGSNTFFQSTASLHSDLPSSNHQPINRALPYILSCLIHVIIRKKTIHLYFITIMLLFHLLVTFMLYAVLFFYGTQKKIFWRKFKLFLRTNWMSIVSKSMLQKTETIFRMPSIVFHWRQNSLKSLQIFIVLRDDEKWERERELWPRLRHPTSQTLCLLVVNPGAHKLQWAGHWGECG